MFLINLGQLLLKIPAQYGLYIKAAVDNSAGSFYLAKNMGMQ
jgi:hypothetical protein